MTTQKNGAHAAQGAQKSRQTNAQQAQDFSMEELLLSEMNLEKIMDGLFQGMDPGLMLGWKPEETENLYALAYNHYVAGDFESAFPVFQVLCRLHPSDTRFWVGFGGCLQGQTRYREAIDAYSMACVSENFGSPVPFLYVATCFVLLQEKAKARTVLETLLVLGDPHNPIHAACHEKARNMLQFLNA